MKHLPDLLSKPGCHFFCAVYVTFARQSEAILLLISRQLNQGGGLALAAGGLHWNTGVAVSEEGLQP